MTDILIIGGGASGLAAAVFAARSGASVLIAERQARVGKKLLATGNGRCNIFNEAADWKRAYHGDLPLMEGAMNAFPPAELTAFFASLGLALVREEEGRVYPAGNQAAGVLDALRLAAEEAGAETVCEFHASDIRRTKDGFAVTDDGGRTLRAKRVIFAVGSPAGKGMGSFDLRLAEKLGHHVTPLLPALTQVKAKNANLAFLKGQRVKGTATLTEDGKTAASETGEILFQEYGLSGIAVMQLSGRAAEAVSRGKAASVVLTLAECDIRARAGLLPGRKLEDFLTGILPKRVGQAVLKDSGIRDLTRAASSLTEAEIKAVEAALSAWRFDVTGVNGFESAQVAHGGLDGREFDPDTLESRKVNGFFAAGEALNVDGDCGGHNLRWAWASGLLAARSALESIKNRG